MTRPIDAATGRPPRATDAEPLGYCPRFAQTEDAAPASSLETRCCRWAKAPTRTPGRAVARSNSSIHRHSNDAKSLLAATSSRSTAAASSSTLHLRRRPACRVHRLSPLGRRHQRASRSGHAACTGWTARQAGTVAAIAAKSRGGSLRNRLDRRRRHGR